MKLALLKMSLLLVILPYSKGFAQIETTNSEAYSIKTEELNKLLGDWTGTLTYIDYSTNKPFAMPANLSVKEGANKNQLKLHNIYPKEPKANSVSKITISKAGDQINKKPIKSKQILDDGLIQIITEYVGKDNKQKAVIRNIYLIGKNQFVIRKEVQFENSEEWLKRNEFNYTR